VVEAFHSPWKTLRVSHSPTLTTTTRAIPDQGLVSYRGTQVGDEVAATDSRPPGKQVPRRQAGVSVPESGACISLSL
jgi:hypothetical protein